MSMHHEIARLEEENRQLRRSREWELQEIRYERGQMQNERIKMENERRRIEKAADRICSAEAAAAERERKGNIRKKLEEEAKMMGKMCGIAVLYKIFNQANQTGQFDQNGTNIQSIEASPEMLKLPSPEASSDEKSVFGKVCLTNNFIKKAFEGIKTK